MSEIVNCCRNCDHLGRIRKNGKRKKGNEPNVCEISGEHILYPRRNRGCKDFEEVTTLTFYGGKCR